MTVIPVQVMSQLGVAEEDGEEDKEEEEEEEEDRREVEMKLNGIGSPNHRPGNPFLSLHTSNWSQTTVS